MINIKDKFNNSKTVVIISIIALCAMLIITFAEIFGDSKMDITSSGISETINSDLNYYLSAIEGVGNAQSLISYDKDGYPMGAVVICDNLNKETEYKVKNAVHVITGIPLSDICVYSGSNN